MVSDATETRGRKAVLHRAGQWAARVHKGTPFDVVVGIGLVTYGFVYLLVAAIAVRIAVTGQRGADTPYAALDALAETEVGEAMLWVTALGLCALTLWQVFETIWRRAPQETRLNKTFGRLGSSFSAIAYLTLGISAARVAFVGHAARDGRRIATESTEVEEVLLRVFAVVVGIVLVALGIRAIYRGARIRFLDDLKESVSTKVIVLGQAGFIGKGITFSIIGALMIVTGFDGRTGAPGLQSVIRLINLSPAGGVLLLLKAFGLALFGVYCFVWAANRRR